MFLSKATLGVNEAAAGDDAAVVTILGDAASAENEEEQQPRSLFCSLMNSQRLALETVIELLFAMSSATFALVLLLLLLINRPPG